MFEFWELVLCEGVKIWLSMSICYRNLSLYFPLKNINLGAQFLTFLNNFITKMMPNFWQLATSCWVYVDFYTKTIQIVFPSF